MFFIKFGKDPKFKSKVSIFWEISSVNAYCFVSFDLHYSQFDCIDYERRLDNTFERLTRFIHKCEST